MERMQGVGKAYDPELDYKQNIKKNGGAVKGYYVEEGCSREKRGISMTRTFKRRPCV